MARATMFKESLERFLLSQIRRHSEAIVDSIEVQLLDTHDAHGCNWEVSTITPEPSEAVYKDLMLPIVQELRASINITVELGS
jgi:hypothetical protein